MLDKCVHIFVLVEQVMLDECAKGIQSGFYAYVPLRFSRNCALHFTAAKILRLHLAKTSENSRNKIVSNADSFRQRGTFDFILNMFDATTWVNRNQSVVIAVTTSEPAIINAVKKSARAQPTSLHLSRGRPPKIVVISVPATHEAQIPRAFLPPAVDVCSRKATNSVERKYFEEVGEHDMKQGIQRAAHPNNKQDSSIIASFNGVSHKKIADQYRQLGSLKTSLLDLIFGVSSYLILIHFLIQTIFSHLIWSIEAQIHKHQNIQFNMQYIQCFCCQ
ncbi:MAG: hypothetical protein EZS28_036053 [Streblomastix strix]|uniref:Uncharacterized protein n=1 Tax=Streblomastix strix TaxID=222440 RepID=A0A5J4UE35_9EUKA|nr:MAG: hypothetical protein EZS28_036053 [Streblomastix strix]